MADNVTEHMALDDSDAADDRADVVLPPAGSAADENLEDALAADDFEAIKTKYLPKDPELETLDETYSTWHIRDWRRLHKKEYSPTFDCGDGKWRVLFFPFGNQVGDCASFYLDLGWTPPPDWYACVQFAIVLWNPNDPSIYTQHVGHHRFNREESDWGFTRFHDLRRLFTPWGNTGRPLVEDDAACLTSYVRVVKDPTGVLWHSFQNYNSKKETGMVGLRNQGATCYLNSLIQSLYFTNKFRKAVYQIPTENDATKNNSAYTLQRLFYSLQTSDTPVSTNELTLSFGWESRQIFEQQDVQELSRKLMERLEEKMKDTPVQNVLNELFVGKYKTYISCINVNYESSRLEDFWDVQLNVSGNKTLDDSFRDYIQVETLDGDNKYDAGEPYKLQDARKGVIFESFPPVLHLHLKRFEYDLTRDAMTKINDRHEFPEEFDATPYMSAEADKSEPWIYQLYGVLVHSGDLNAGHYYAFLRPRKDGPFFKFDDDKVIPATKHETLEENFGGEYANLHPNTNGIRQPYMRGLSRKRSMNAYMLVYIRKSRVDEVMVDVTLKDVPAFIERRIAEETAELVRRRKEREEQHLYMPIQLISDESFRHHHGFDLTSPDLEASDPAAFKQCRVLRAKKLAELAAEVADERGLRPEQVRFWVMVNRQNKTTRPDQPLRDPTLTVEEALARSGSPKVPPFRLYVETADPNKDGSVYWEEESPAAAQSPNGSLIVFLKHFDVATQTLSGLTHLFVQKQAKVGDLNKIITERMGWPAGTEVLLFEEIKPSMVEPMKPKQTFHQSEIQDGDIICFQKKVSESELPPNAEFAEARQYYDYMLHRMAIMFASIKSEDSGHFVLVLNGKMTYDQWSSRVAEHLGVPPGHIRFAPVTHSTGKARPFIRRNEPKNLQQTMFAPYASYTYNAQRRDALYYEVLDTDLSEYETKKLLKVTWLPDGLAKEQPYDVLVPKTGNVGDVTAALQKRIGLLDETAARMRFFEAYNGRMYKELPEAFSVAGINDYMTVYAEPRPSDEESLGEGDLLVTAYHFDREPSRAHGIPFRFVVKPGEFFRDTKERLSKRTSIRGKQLERIKFAVTSRGSAPRYVDDDDVLADVLARMGVTGSGSGGGNGGSLPSGHPAGAVVEEASLGLDHPNKSRGWFSKGESFSIK